MIKLLKKIISPPVVPDDEKSNKIEFLHYGSILLFTFTLVLFFINLLFGTEAAKNANWLLLIIAFLQIIIQVLIRKGLVDAASYILLTIGWGVMTMISRSVGGVRDEAVFGYVLIIITSGYLMNWKTASLYTLASIAALWWLAYLEIHGIFIPDIDDAYQTALDLTVVFILILLVIYYLNKALTNALAKVILELNERTRVENELQKSNKSLQESESNLKIVNSLKDRFFSILAHDLRGTTGSLNNVLQDLDESYEDYSEDEKKKIINIAANAAKKNYGLLAGLLEWGQAQKNNPRGFDPKNFNVKSLVNSITELFNDNAINKKLAIINSVDPDDQLYADWNMLHAVMRNFISNSIKFTEPGGSITISSDKSEDFYTITVGDTGIGISEDLLRKILSPEFLHSMPGTEGETGAGIGLTICNEYVELHGGTISIESEKGKGTRVHTRLPIAKIQGDLNFD